MSAKRFRGILNCINSLESRCIMRINVTYLNRNGNANVFMSLYDYCCYIREMIFEESNEESNNMSSLNTIFSRATISQQSFRYRNKIGSRVTPCDISGF